MVEYLCKRTISTELLNKFVDITLLKRSSTVASQYSVRNSFFEEQTGRLPLMILTSVVGY